MSGLQNYGQHLLRRHAGLRTELERLDGGRHEPAINEAELADLLSGNPSEIRRRLKDLKQQIRQLESAVMDARSACRDRIIEREGLPSEVKDLIGDQDPDVWWRKFGAAFDTHN